MAPRQLLGEGDRSTKEEIIVGRFLLKLQCSLRISKLLTELGPTGVIGVLSNLVPP